MLVESGAVTFGIMTSGEELRELVVHEGVEGLGMTTTPTCSLSMAQWGSG